MLIAALTLLAAAQDPAPPPAAPAVPAKTALRVALTPNSGDGAERLAWSPKGAKVALTADGERLRGTFPLGPTGTREVAVELSRSHGSERFDQLAIDIDRDGTFADAERLSTKPSEQRGKWWSSFDATIQIPTAAGARRPYPMSLWFVADPQEPDAAPALRWSRRGWHDGAFELDGKTVHVLITELEMDGVFTTTDRWQLGADRTAMLKAEARGLDTHAWCHGRAFRVTAVSPDGANVHVEAFDPGITEAEERERADRLKADRTAKRAGTPLAFGKDLPAALADAARTQQRVFVDFQTTWCGPCKTMDEWVFTAADVVTAAAGTACVRLDGDEQRDLVKKYDVKGYPTLLLLDAKGEVVRRAVGYQSVAAMVQFFAK